jgi:hypothetical protein
MYNPLFLLFISISLGFWGGYGTCSLWFAKRGSHAIIGCILVYISVICSSNGVADWQVLAKAMTIALAFGGVTAYLMERWLSAKRSNMVLFGKWLRVSLILQTTAWSIVAAMSLLLGLSTLLLTFNRVIETILITSVVFALYMQIIRTSMKFQIELIAFNGYTYEVKKVVVATAWAWFITALVVELVL